MEFDLKTLIFDFEVFHVFKALVMVTNSSTLKFLGLIKFPFFRKILIVSTLVELSY